MPAAWGRGGFDVASWFWLKQALHVWEVEACAGERRNLLEQAIALDSGRAAVGKQRSRFTSQDLYREER